MILTTITILGISIFLFHQYHLILDDYKWEERTAEGIGVFLVTTAVEVGIVFLVARWVS